MKKLLIASAALAMVAGTAQAQSSVTVYGVLDVGYSAVENTTNTSGVASVVKHKNTGNGDGGLATSRLGFRGVEDLGGGLKANFVLEYDLVDVGMGGNGKSTTADAVDASNATVTADRGFGARYSWVGLEDAKLGQLRLGRQEQSIHSVLVAGSAGAANNVAGAIYSNGTTGAQTDATIRPHSVFLNRAITYISPSFNGVTFELQTAEQKITSGANSGYAKETGGSIKYVAGKLALGFGTFTAENDAVANNTSQTKVTGSAFSGSYNFGPAQAFAMHTRNKATDVDANVLATVVNSAPHQFVGDTKATEVGVRVPMGKTTLWASAFDGDRKTGANGATTSDVSGYQVGARYDLSKRTAAYAIYGEQEIKGTGTNTGNGLESKFTSVGVRHSF